MCSVPKLEGEKPEGPRNFVSQAPVTIVGGGSATVRDLEAALALAPGLVAADGGAGFALKAGKMPDAVVGDLDSLTPQDRARIAPERVCHIPEQDSTDFDKALQMVDAPLILGVGFLGARVDHQLAALSSLVRFSHKPCVLLGGAEIILNLPPRLEVDLQAGDVVSLFPLAAVTGRSVGLEWPIEGLAFAPDGQIGTSNRALGPVVLEADGPGLLVILPRDALNRVVGALQAGSAAAV